MARSKVFVHDPLQAPLVLRGLSGSIRWGGTPASPEFPRCQRNAWAFSIGRGSEVMTRVTGMLGVPSHRARETAPVRLFSVCLVVVSPRTGAMRLHQYKRVEPRAINVSNER